MMTRSLLIAGMALLGVGGVAASFAERRTRERETTKKKPLSSKVSFVDGQTLSQGMIYERMRTPVDLTGFDSIPVSMSTSYKAAFGEDATSIYDLVAIPTPVSPFQVVWVRVYSEIEGGSPFMSYSSLAENSLENVVETLKGFGLYARFLQDSSASVVAIHMSVGDESPFSAYRVELGYKFDGKSGSTNYFLEVQDGEILESGPIFASPSSTVEMPDIVGFFDPRLMVAGPDGTIGALVAVGSTSEKTWVVEAFHPDKTASVYDASFSLDAAIGTFLAQGLGVVVNLSDQAQYAVWDSVAQMFAANDPVLSTQSAGSMILSDATVMALLSVIAPDVEWSEGTSLAPDSREGKLYAGVKLLGTLAYQCTIAGY